MISKDKHKSIEEEIEEEFEGTDIGAIDVSTVTQYKTDMGFKTLVDSFNAFRFVIPKYQRKYVWSKDQVQNLAISLIRGLPIPPIYVYRDEKGKLVILDGQQRMLSLFLYYIGKYIKGSSKTLIELQALNKKEKIERWSTFEELLTSEYPLKNVNYKLLNYNNEPIDINYDKLSDDLRTKLDFTSISVVEIKVDSKEKNRVFYKIFENLNSGGSELKNQELRNGVYQSIFYDMLHEVNNNNVKWRNINGAKHKHSKDVEFLLRFSAYEYFFKIENEEIILTNYNSSYPKFLNDFSDKAIKFKKRETSKYKKNIERFLDRIEVDEEDKKSNTKIMKNINLLLESLYFASLYVDGKYKIKKEFWKTFKNDNEYNAFISHGSSDKTKVKGRLKYVYDKLSKYVEGNK